MRTFITVNAEAARRIDSGKAAEFRLPLLPQPLAVYHDGAVYVEDDEPFVIVESTGHTVRQIVLPYCSGQTIAVKEPWAKVSDFTVVDPDVGMPDGYIWKAEWNAPGAEVPWRSPTSLPARDARMLLKLTKVWVERLDDMTDDRRKAGVLDDRITAAFGRHDFFSPDKNPFVICHRFEPVKL